MKNIKAVAIAAVVVCATVVAAAAQGPRKETVEGIRNFTVVDPTIGCAGATEVAAIPALATRGYKAIINLREATEAGAAIDETHAAAATAGIRFIHLPFNNAKPDPAVIDAFIKALADPANSPTFINCGSANRVGGLMLAKRMLVDGWTEARATEEATTIGLTNPTLKQFALDYVGSKKK